jgi:hypothetical protein
MKRRIKPGITGAMRAFHPLYRTMESNERREVNSMFASLRHFSEDDIAKERFRIISFYKQFGEKATIAAFGLNRKTIWVWQRRLQKHQFHLGSLTPSSTKPHNRRTMTTTHT